MMERNATIYVCDLCGAESDLVASRWTLKFEAPLADRAADLCPNCRKAFEPAVRRKITVSEAADGS